MSYILNIGGITEKINAVFLFDGLYSNVDLYTNWIENFNGRFINIFTPDGGTKDESEKLIRYFDTQKIQYSLIDTENFSANDIKDYRIVIIKSQLGHSEVIHTKNQFQKFLESSM